MSSKRIQSFVSIAGLFFLLALAFKSDAAPVELSCTVSQAFTQKLVNIPDIHTGDIVHYLVMAKNSGTTGINIPIDIFFPQQIAPSSGSGTGFSCSLSSRRSLHCITTSLLLPDSPRPISIRARAPLTINGDSQTFTIKAKIDPKNVVTDENNETDNESTVQTTVVPRGPDLTVDLSGSDQTAIGASEVKYVVTAKNIGDRATSTNPIVVATLPSVVTFRRVENSQFGGCSHAYGTLHCNLGNPLAVGTSESATIIGFVSQSVANNTVLSFGAKIDMSQTELDTGNNSANVKTTVTELGDLQLTTQAFSRYDCSGPTLPFIQPNNTSYVLRARVKNTGHMNTAATKVHATLLDNALAMNCGTHRICTDCDHTLSTVCTGTDEGASCDIPPLAPGGFVDLTLNAVTSNMESFHVEYEVDPGHEIVESHENNNRISQTVK